MGIKDVPEGPIGADRWGYVTAEAFAVPYPPIIINKVAGLIPGTLEPCRVNTPRCQSSNQEDYLKSRGHAEICCFMVS